MTANHEVFASVGINAILAKLTEMDKTLAVMSCDLTALRKTSTEEIQDLDTRMRSVESERWPWLKIGSMVAVMALVFSVAFGLLAQMESRAQPPPPPVHPKPSANP